MEVISLQTDYGKKINGIFSSIGILPFIIAGMGLFIQSQNPTFMTANNLINVLRQVAIIAVISFGMTVVIITGNIDLSTGAIMGLASVFASTMMKDLDNIVVGILIGLIVGILAGLINGIILVKSKIHPFLVTLGTAMIFKGIAYIYTQGMPISNLPKAFLDLGNTSFLQIPLLTIIAIVVYIFVWIILSKTRFGLHIYEVGGREEAAVSAGINVNSIKIRVYCIAGFLAAVAGIMMTIRVVSSHASLGTNYHLQAVGASVVGGASLAGGRGKILGTAYGVLIMGILANGLNLLKISSFWQEIAVGMTIVIAIVIDNLRLTKRIKS
jgi:ribose/xylose/arabinose/galactoside ABC-type transport system permease subunit